MQENDDKILFFGGLKIITQGKNINFSFRKNWASCLFL